MSPLAAGGMYTCCVTRGAVLCVGVGVGAGVRDGSGARGRSSYRFSCSGRDTCCADAPWTRELTLASEAGAGAEVSSTPRIGPAMSVAAPSESPRQRRGNCTIRTTSPDGSARYGTTPRQQPPDAIASRLAPPRSGRWAAAPARARSTSRGSSTSRGPYCDRGTLAHAWRASATRDPPTAGLRRPLARGSAVQGYQPADAPSWHALGVPLTITGTRTGALVPPDQTVCVTPAPLTAPP